MRLKLLLLLSFCSLSLFAQSTFNPADYAAFLEDNTNLKAEQIINRYKPQQPFYNSNSDRFNLTDYDYLDSIKIKYGLSENELEKLKDNHFVVSERLTFDCFGRALHDIYEKDLPVFFTTDAALYALHFSYDRILLDIEKTILEKKLSTVLDALYDSFGKLQAQYGAIAELKNSLADVDIYITIAKSLLDEKLQPSHIADREFIQEIWQAIEKEQMTYMPLFSKRIRRLDFSQFTVRGHYTTEFWGDNGLRTLGNYFKAMMWLGRIDFYLTPPPVGSDELPWTPAEIKRMIAGACLLDELLDMSNAHNELNEIDDLITFMVGESDNLTPAELSEVKTKLNVKPADVFDDKVYNAMQSELKSQLKYGQKIMSAFFIVDPFSSEPDELPVSYRLCGQRFIIDSYILANVVYDRIIYNGEKVWRPLPDPLDAMFVLGNDNALPLLSSQIEQYKYASQLAALRYLVDAYDDNFWDQSLYNTWLNGIRLLNPSENPVQGPYFMSTVAWQQQKLNTQLCSWTQLRHDNLLYAKQSYTGGTSCSYPHSFIEPYPAFYRQIAKFAEKAEQVLVPFIEENNWEGYSLKEFFPKVKNIMNKLDLLAQKQNNRQEFNDEEKTWLAKMLFISGGSGAPPFSGWYSDLFYRLEWPREGEYEGHDYLVADVHTQPTDEWGGVVGHVLHVGVGNVNLGIFLADSPSNGYAPMAFVGPVMSYYEKVTSNFERLTDEKWADMVKSDQLPARPDWVNVYMTDEYGNNRAKGRELPGVTHSSSGTNGQIQPLHFVLQQNYPNPFNPSTTISYHIQKTDNVILSVYDLLGREIAVLINDKQNAGVYSVAWNADGFSSGVYFAKLRVGNQVQTIKMMLMR